MLVLNQDRTCLISVSQCEGRIGEAERSFQGQGQPQHYAAGAGRVEMRLL